MISIITFVFTYFVSSQIIYIAIITFLNKDTKSSYIPLYLLSLGFGPILISIAVKFLIAFFPYYPRAYYILSIGLLFIIIIGIGYKNFTLSGSIGKKIAKDLLSNNLFNNNLRIIILVLTLFFYLLIYIQASALPIIGSDEIKLVYNAKYRVENDIFNRQKIDRNIKLKSSLNRFFRGYHYTTQGLYEWFFITNNEKMADLLCRTAAPIYYLYLMLLLGGLLWYRGEWACIWGFTLFLSIPLLIHKTIGNSQDPGNLYLMTLTLAWLAQAFEEKHAKYFILFAIILLFSLLSANINFLLILFAGISAINIILVKLKNGSIFILVLIICLISIFIISDIVEIDEKIDAKDQIQQNLFREANNYHANKDILNRFQSNNSKGLYGLLDKKWVLLKSLFEIDNFNIIPYAGMVGILVWAIYVREKQVIEIIMLSSILTYLFLIAFQDSHFFSVSAVYLSKIKSNPYFLVYSRYLLINIIMMAFFSAILLGKIFNRLRVRWIRWGLAIIIMSILSVPIKQTLFNRKQSLGIDDWKKVFYASDHEKLISYREGYGKIIQFIEENVKDNEAILTPTRYKFIPYYSQKNCYDVENIKLKKLSNHNAKEIFDYMKSQNIAYILPTEKGRDYSFIEQSPIKKIINDISLSYIAFDNAHWRMYKLRDEIKITTEIPVIIPNGNFKILNGNHPSNWNVYAVNSGSVIDPKNINWGTIVPKKQLKQNSVYIKNPGSQTTYLYTGPGDLRHPPSRYGGDQYKLENSINYLIKYTVKASRPVSMNFWLIEYDESGKIKWNLKKHMLNTNFSEMIASFNSSDSAHEYRIAFHIFDDAMIYIKDLSMKKKILD